MKKVISIEGMRCGHCTASVDKALREIAGVSDVTVDLAAKKAEVEAADTVTDEALRKAVDDLGFQVCEIRSSGEGVRAERRFCPDERFRIVCIGCREELLSAGRNSFSMPEALFLMFFFGFIVRPVKRVP